MPKNSVSEWDETPGNNTEIAGINIDEGCASSGINNAIRAVMAQTKAFFKSSIFRLRDSTDQTKLLAFDLSGLTAATTRTVTLPDKSGTLAMTSDVSAAYVLSSAQSPSTSTIEFNDIPPAVKRINVHINGFSTTGTTSVLVQLGTAGGWITSGYVGSRLAATAATALASAVDAAGVFVAGGSAAALYSGVIRLSRLAPGADSWVFEGSTSRSDTASFSSLSGIVAAGAEVTRLRINAGADTRDSGSVSISYEM